MGINYCSVFPHFCCNDILYWKGIKNVINQVSGWWDIREWWWKVGFTLRAIRRVRLNWLVSSSGVISTYLWVLSLKIASSGANTLATFLKYPCLGPQMTTSGTFLTGACATDLARLPPAAHGELSHFNSGQLFEGELSLSSTQMSWYRRKHWC